MESYERPIRREMLVEGVDKTLRLMLKLLAKFRVSLTDDAQPC